MFAHAQTRQYSILLVIVRERVAFFVRRAKNEQAVKAVVYIKAPGIDYIYIYTNKVVYIL